jgi:NSS family neurotransmitter:Na+ symporter
MILLSLPCVLGFNVLSNIQPLGPGSGIMDLEDLIVSNFMLPLGSLIFVLFCTLRAGWGWDKFVDEANTGKGIKVPSWLRPYLTYILPLIIIVVFVVGIISVFK